MAQRGWEALSFREQTGEKKLAQKCVLIPSEVDWLWDWVWCAHTLGKRGRTLVHQCLNIMPVKFAALREKKKSMILCGECVAANYAGAD